MPFIPIIAVGLGALYLIARQVVKAVKGRKAKEQVQAPPRA